MDDFNLKCLTYSKMNVCFFNKSGNVSGPSLLVCHKCVLESQDQLSKYQDLFDVFFKIQQQVLEKGFQIQDQLNQFNFQILFERVQQRKQGLITSLQKKVEELQQLIQTLISQYDSLEKEIKVNLDNLNRNTELQEMREKLKQNEWDNKKKHDEFSKVYKDNLSKGKLEYQKFMFQYFQLIKDRQLTYEIEQKISEIDKIRYNTYKEIYQEGKLTCQIIKEVRKPDYENYQIKQVLYQNTSSEQFYQLLKQPIERYFLFFKNSLKIIIKFNGNSLIHIKKYSKKGEEKYSLNYQGNVIYEKNVFQLQQNYYSTAFKLYKSLRHIQVDSKPVNVEKLIVLDHIKFNDPFRNKIAIIDQNEFLL